MCNQKRIYVDLHVLQTVPPQLCEPGRHRQPQNRHLWRRDPRQSIQPGMETCHTAEVHRNVCKL